ncbi:hypothetical protein [Actinobaculum sp. 352]|uniref:hypothetical protein n=1 Tax=Actinobaculum sp. 352 TaxID=2490946 RepID=UPI000F7D7E5B|nr:hypothetical protein [Actinobaculum sp. 352]RTE49347.1 hypothetical protein EKN07_07205 [Actinobaculum sp. 352]
MDLTQTIEPRSDQLNADDLISGPRDVTITGVTAGTAEQPVNIELAEYPGRPYKPAKSMRRVLVTAWGPDSDAYTGRRMRLYRDPSVRFGRDEVGGIRISHLSDIDGPVQLALTVTRGKRARYVVEPLPGTGGVADEAIEQAATVEELRALWATATPDQQARITQRATQLTEQAKEQQK